MNRWFPLAAVAAVFTLPVQAGERTGSLVPLGRTTVVDGLRITPLKIVSDSRCPINARCVWAGELRASVKVAYKGQTRTMELVLGKPQPFVWGKIELVEAIPHPTGLQNKAPPYRLRFSAERRDVIYLKDSEVRPSRPTP